MENIKARDLNFGDRFTLLNEGLKHRTMYTVVAKPDASIFSLNEDGNRIVKEVIYDGYGIIVRKTYEKEGGVKAVGVAIHESNVGFELKNKSVAGNIYVKRYSEGVGVELIKKQAKKLPALEVSRLEKLTKPY